MANEIPRGSDPSGSLDNGGNGDVTPTLTGQKAVTIFDEPEHIPHERSYAPNSPKIHKASITGKKMTGRPPLVQQYSTSPNISKSLSPTLSRNISYLKLEDIAPSDSSPTTETPISTPRDDAHKLLSQVTEWLHDEKAKREIKGGGHSDEVRESRLHVRKSHHKDVDHDLALEKLEKILESFASTMGQPLELRPKKSRSIGNFRHGSIAKAFKKTNLHAASSDTEWVGEDINVPHVEAHLDNSRTVAFTGGLGETEDIEAAQQRDLKHWEQFKRDIVRLTHTLKVRGWRRIPIEKGDSIHVERLSGALTNAVYVVRPPRELPPLEKNSNSKGYTSKSEPMELLLRIYGPQAEHLIDRDVELSILGRLARQKIGPRLLGYFTNGRFEEYFHAKTLTAEDIHRSETSKQIAKRMRELHDVIELLPSEREGGPEAFKSWDQRLERCEKVITWLDLQVKRVGEGHETPSKRYTRRGLVCGVEWPVFRKAFEAYRKALTAQYGGDEALRKRLIFAHNDAQYGNLMRVNATGESPLIRPDNQHRQLIVIDFEYAGANAPGYEFANHFTEWCYNYHEDPTYACDVSRYPTLEEQRTFFRAYVMHRPQFHPNASSTPKMDGRDTTNIADFMLDARAPLGAPAMDYDDAEKSREKKMESDIDLLIRETRLWRIAAAVHWVTWGIVQAKIPELDDQPKKSKTSKVAAALDRVRGHFYPRSDPVGDDVKETQESSKHDRPEGREQEEAHEEGNDSDAEEIEEFDYLAYAQDRAMLFWGDCLQLGIVKETDLPESLLERVKTVKH